MTLRQHLRVDVAGRYRQLHDNHGYRCGGGDPVGVSAPHFFCSVRTQRTPGKIERTEDEAGRQIVAVAVQVHRETGCGLPETVYEVIPARELRGTGLTVERQISVPISYKGLEFDEGFRVDRLIDNKVIVDAGLEATVPARGDS